MADVNKLRSDVQWWKEELRIRKDKVSEAERMLAQRQRELESAEREEKNRQSPATRKY